MFLALKNRAKGWTISEVDVCNILKIIINLAVNKHCFVL